MARNEGWIDEVKLGGSFVWLVFVVLDPLLACKLSFDSSVNMPLT
jgi:hypothetical protein